MNYITRVTIDSDKRTITTFIESGIGSEKYVESFNDMPIELQEKIIDLKNVIDFLHQALKTVKMGKDLID